MIEHHDTGLAAAMPAEELRQIAVRVAAELRATPAGEALSPEVHARFVTLRAALFQRGVYDPVLVRYDSATVARATLSELGEQLAAVAESFPTPAA